MTVEVNAIKIAIEELVRSAGERLDRVRGRTEDWLNEDFRLPSADHCFQTLF
jgi:hypothetical protein